MLSIIIPCYNCEKYISECINSFVGDLTIGDEVILINDGSTDNSFNVCEKIAKQHSEFIRFYDRDNQGVSAARNYGIKQSRNSHLMFIDADDLLVEGAITHIKEILKNKPDYEIVMFGIQTFYENPKPLKIGTIHGEELIVEEVLSNFIVSERINSVVNKVYKKETIQDYDISFDEDIVVAEDLLFNIYYFRHISSVVFFDESLYLYRKDNNYSKTSIHRSTDIYTFMWVDKVFKKFFPQYEKEINETTLKRIFSNLINMSYHSDYNSFKYHSNRLLAFKYEIFNNPSDDNIIYFLQKMFINCPVWTNYALFNVGYWFYRLGKIVSERIE